jgi:asparagine synthase (glutamine-hydrolysing)
VKVDRMSMAHSLEARSPLLDHELIEFCARIPSALKLGRRGSKIALRDAVAGLFPANFFDRPKMGFSIPLAEWLRGPLRQECEELGRRDTLAACGLDARGVRSMIEDHMAGRADSSIVIWNLLALAKWAEIYLV